MLGLDRSLDRRDETLSPKSADEVEIQAGQRSADLVHGTARSEGSEVDGDQSGAIDQFNHHLLGFGVVAGREDDGTRFVRREVLDPLHRHVADRFDKPRSRRHLGDHLA